MELADLLRTIEQEHPNYQDYSRRLALLELKLHQAGLSSDFLTGDYR